MARKNKKKSTIYRGSDRTELLRQIRANHGDVQVRPRQIKGPHGVEYEYEVIGAANPAPVSEHQGEPATAEVPFHKSATFQAMARPAPEPIPMSGPAGLMHASHEADVVMGKAHRQANEMRMGAHDEAHRIRESAMIEAANITRQAEYEAGCMHMEAARKISSMQEQAEQTLREAQQEAADERAQASLTLTHAENTLTEAQEQAQQILAQAQIQAQQIIDQAVEDADQARARAEAMINNFNELAASLQRNASTLMSDVAQVHHWIQEDLQTHAPSHGPHLAQPEDEAL